MVSMVTQLRDYLISNRLSEILKISIEDPSRKHYCFSSVTWGRLISDQGILPNAGDG